MLYSIILLAISAASIIFSAVHLIISLQILAYRQALAYRGDAKAAKRIILPCYWPFKKALAVFFLLIGAALLACISLKPSAEILFLLLQYFFFCVSIAYASIPLLLIQKSISQASFRTLICIVLPWWFVATGLWVASVHTSTLLFQILFLLTSSIPPLLLDIAILTKLKSSRVQIGSVSNRNAVELSGIHSLVLSLGTIAALTGYHTHNMTDNSFLYISVYLVIASILLNFLFSFALYRTLLADTKYWRGMGKHNQAGIKRTEQSNPSIDLSTASSSFQEVLTGMRDFWVDFAFIRVDNLIGKGASADVYCGRFKNDLIAIKISSPPEVTNEVLEVFVKEAKFSSALRHRNIVKFYGICVRPPQIGMVLELCEGGSLKHNIEKTPSKWTPAARMRACLHAAEAVKHVHAHNIIHRDIKAENFFVGKKLVVKLGDFGECCYRRSDEEGERMSIVGTVAYMAPELIAAKTFYDEKIDIYALAITFWEIWTGKTPYEHLDTFKLYEHVQKGERLPLDERMPEGFIVILQQAWHNDPEIRPTARHIVSILTDVLDDMTGNTHRSSFAVTKNLVEDAIMDVSDLPDPNKGSMFSLAKMFLKMKASVFGPDTLDDEEDDIDDPYYDIENPMAKDSKDFKEVEMQNSVA